MDWIRLAQTRYKQRACVSREITIRIHLNTKNILTKLRNSLCLRRGGGLCSIKIFHLLIRNL